MSTGAVKKYCNSAINRKAGIAETMLQLVCTSEDANNGSTKRRPRQHKI